ncbi:MAG: class I SAM-dependent DNA methyltransferase [Candidatus Heimdallarchaeota archaeon]
MYGRGFAQVYNKLWVEFVTLVAPRIREYYEERPLSKTNKLILDLCCGTGQLAVHFLENGYQVLGIDLSEEMLSWARKNTAQYLETGSVEFQKGDVTDFTLEPQFGLIVSTFDSFNHLENFADLEKCLLCAYRALVEDGLLIFDLNTRKGLLRWNEIFIQDTEEAMIVTRGIYDGQSDKAWTRISGFVQTPNGTYERFSETLFNTVFELEKVKKCLLAIGWRDVHFALGPELQTAIETPEKERRVFCIARK